MVSPRGLVFSLRCATSHTSFARWRPGYILTSDRTQDIINAWYRVLGRVKTKANIDVSRRENSPIRLHRLKPSNSSCHAPAQVLKVDGVVNVSREFVMLVFEDEKRRIRSDTGFDMMKKQRCEFLCSLLIELNEASALPFRLQDIVEDYADHVRPSKLEQSWNS